MRHFDGQMAPTGPGGGTSYNARMPVSTGASTLWYRISVTPGSGVDNIAIKCIDNATAPTEMAWSSALPVYEHATSALEGGRFGFLGASQGYNGIDNLTIQPWNAGTSSFGADPIVNEDFTLDGNNYNSDSFDYDASGNLTYDGNFAFEYDAWNRLIGLAKASKVSSVVKKGSNFATCLYDGRGRRISRAIAETGTTDATYHYYYDGDRLIEIRNGSDQSITQYVWGTRYVDELCQIAHNGNPQTDNDCLDSSDDHVLYTLHDANYNVTAVVDKDGLMRERYEYSPYGTRQIYTCSDPSTRTADPKLLTPIWRSMRVKNTTTTLDMAWGLCDVGHQGLMHDEFEQMIHNRARTLHPQLQRFVQRDPLDNDLPGGGYQDGMGLYQYVRGNPINRNDPWGQQSHLQQIANQLRLMGTVACLLCDCEHFVDCRKDVSRVATAIQRTVDANYGKGPFWDRKQARGGFFCWDWAAAFQKSFDTVNAKHLTATIGAARIPPVDRTTNIQEHQYLEILVGHGKEYNMCRFAVDDGWISGRPDEWVHSSSALYEFKYESNWELELKPPRLVEPMKICGPD